MVWKDLGALEIIEKQGRFCGFLSPYQDLRNFLSSLPAAEYGNLALKATSAIAGGKRRRVGGGAFLFCCSACLEAKRRKSNIFENVSCTVSPADQFPTLFSLCCTSVLQLKLQQRRTREELVSQGIMPRKYHLNSFLCLSVYSTCFWMEGGLGMKNGECESPTLFHSTFLLIKHWGPWKRQPPRISRSAVGHTLNCIQNNGCIACCGE